MERLDDLIARAGELRVPPSMVIRAELGREVVRSLASVEELVLQGGGALRHVYGSERFSADLDYAQTLPLDPPKLAARLADVAQRVTDSWSHACEISPSTHRGKLHRTKLRALLRPGMTLVLAVEIYEIPVHRPVLAPLDDGVQVRVEAPEEIIADKMAASIDRLRTRGSIKLRDVYDIDLLLQLCLPDAQLVTEKISDYGMAPGREALAEVAASLDAFSQQALIEQLRDVLPAAALARVDAGITMARVRRVFEELAR